MKLTGYVTGACVVWTIVSLYQSIVNVIVLYSPYEQSDETTPTTAYYGAQRRIDINNVNNIDLIKQYNDANQQQQKRSISEANSRIYREIASYVTDADRSTDDNTAIMMSTRAFPRWGTSLEDENNIGIDIAPLMDFIVNSSVVAFTRKQDLYNPNYIATTDHSDAVGKWFPEILYVVDHNGIHISQRHRNITAINSVTINEKLIPTEKLMNFALQLLKSNVKYSIKTWPRLVDTLIHNQDEDSSGFPLLFWFGDYTECNYQNWKGNLSIPLYTNAASVSCNHTFPFITYQTGRDSNMNWTEFIPQQHAKYPWDTKIRKVVWRGSLTGKIYNSTHKSPRWNMVQMVYDLQREYGNESSSTSLDPFVLDVGATRLPPRHNYWRPSLHEIGGLVPSIAMEDFQLYRGILDMDGNSWSSRFGRLLCYNSVVLKVEPTWVDYFYYKDGWENVPKLQAWVHYIPVKADLSNLLEMAAFVADPQNDEFLLNIVSQANYWCRKNMIRRVISIDILNIWERYIKLFDINNANWTEQHWAPVKQEIFHPSNPLALTNKEIGMPSASG